MKLKSLFVALVAALTMASCTKDDEVNVIVFSTPNLQYAMIGGDKEFSITYDGDWSITIEETDFITAVSPMSGTGDATITVSVSENETGEARETDLIINDQAFKIYQEAAPDVEYAEVVGSWSTDDGSFNFVFNEDLTCVATMSMMNYAPLSGTYEIEGNLIYITITGYSSNVIITIKDIQENEMTGSVNGSTITLARNE